ncbi:hypothetical protein HK405_007470 [Cladochytrium tenue]|nr:hypothetical protein HK405_007470 [Cladochytrium tenue]
MPDDSRFGASTNSGKSVGTAQTSATAAAGTGTGTAGATTTATSAGGPHSGVAVSIDSSAAVNIKANKHILLSYLLSHDPGQIALLGDLASSLTGEQYRDRLDVLFPILISTLGVETGNTELLHKDRVDVLVPNLDSTLKVQTGVGQILNRVARDLSDSKLLELLDVSLDAQKNISLDLSVTLKLLDAFSVLLGALTERGLTSRVETAAQYAFERIFQRAGLEVSSRLVQYVGRMTLQDLSRYTELALNLNQEWPDATLKDFLSAVADLAAAEIKNGAFTFSNFERALVAVLAVLAEQTVSIKCECLDVLRIFCRLHTALSGAAPKSSALANALLVKLLNYMRDRCTKFIRPIVSELLQSSRPVLSVDVRSMDFLRTVWAEYVFWGTRPLYR